LTLLAFATPALADEQAYRLRAVGYSEKEAADIVSGRITRQALDTARRMIAAGHGREAAADFLDRHYRADPPAAAVPVALAMQAIASPHTRPVAAPVERRTARPAAVVAAAAPSVAALIAQYAALHGVDAALVRAVIAVESGFSQAARSPAGATGLMQLMPATARALGVNPHNTAQNIEGGVRYLAQQLKAFGGLELALVAYNAGPAFARRYAAGQAALYGETRQYVARVLARLRAL
jgi:soluble lytic murein transglycosylase-like protein